MNGLAYTDSRLLATLAAVVMTTSGYAQNAAPASGALPSSPTPGQADAKNGPQPVAKPQDWNFHLQQTDIFQGDLKFPAKYTGANSLSPSGQVQHTETLDFFAGKRLWDGAELHSDFLIWQGYGLSQTLGIESFPSGEAYKFGAPSPFVMFARLFVRQTFGLGGPQEDVPDSALSLAGKQDVSRITVTAGRFTPTDISDTNTYASNPRTQFMSWALVNNLAWDYAADSVGYTSGLSVELNRPKWALRYGWFVMPSLPNSFTGDDEFMMWPHEGKFGPIFREWGMNTEFEGRYNYKDHPGTVRLQAWLNQANMASYQDATAILKAGGPGADWQAARSFRYKYGFGLNWEQEMSKNTGLFSRLGFNDGREEAWAFADATWTASLGASLKGEAWRRAGDTLGIAAVVSGASAAEQAFLQAGGTGILNGDGALTYRPEDALETYYDTQIFKNCRLALDYQFVSNPSFNADRGPVSIFGLRLHYEF